MSNIILAEKPQLITLGDLKFEKFNAKQETVQSQPLPFETFVHTQNIYTGNSPIQQSGQEILYGIEKVLNEIIPDSNRSWGNIFVYKSQYQAPGYVKKINADTPITMKELSQDTPITDLCFQRFIGTIDLIGNGKYTERIAIKCDDNKTLQLAIGLNVNVCDNFTLFGENVLSTNSRVNRGYTWIMDRIRDYAKKIEEKFVYDIGTIRNLEAKSVNKAEKERFVGSLLMNYETKEEVLPVTMITDMSRQIKKVEINNAWDILNAGTEVVRFDSNTGDAIIETMHKFANYTLNEYGVNYEFTV